MDFEKASRIQTEYKEGISYKRQMGFMDKWPEYERFKAGQQWPPPTDRTKDLPRPVFNIIEQIQGHKVASVLAENVRMVYSPEEILQEDDALFQKASEAADLFTRFSDATAERIQQDSLDEEVLESAANIGSGYVHYYWDSSIKGGMKFKYDGHLCGEFIDPMNIFFGNPQQTNIQKQPWVIISTRDLVENVKKEAETNKVPKQFIELITPDKDTDEQGYEMSKQELTDSKKVTTLTKFWRDPKTGTVKFTKVCGTVIYKDETDTQRKLYPIAGMVWKRRKKSIYGVSETEGLIPNQKAINLLMALQLLNAQITGFPKLMVRKSFIKQQITNQMGEILNDGGDGNWNAQYLNPGNMSPHVPVIVDKYVEFTKRINGANEDALGERVSKDLNATAIMLLQKAAGVAIESVKRRYYRYKEDTGRIWSEFYQVNYNTDRMVTLKDDDENPYSTLFNGSSYQDINLSLKIDIGPSSSYSETLVMAGLDKLLDKNLINFPQYLKFAPKNAYPYKERLLREINNQQGGGIEQILARLSPEEQQAFRNAPPQVQQQLIAGLQPQAPQPQMIGAG